MLGIENIGVYIPKNRISNSDVLEKFEIDETFLNEKIGVMTKSLMGQDENTSDLCLKAFENLKNKTDVLIEEIDCVILITQNPDQQIPHTSSVIHGRLGLKKECACFDVSLGCSGFVYGLSIIKSFMDSNGFKKGLLFTADPYSKVIDNDDKNTSLLFGDAATATLISSKSKYIPSKFTFGTFGEKGSSLQVSEGKLSMNGRDIFNFTSVAVPKDIKRCLELNEKNLDEVELFVFHPGSKYIVSTLKRRLKIAEDKVKSDMSTYGNTVSSSIPILLEEEMNGDYKNILISGFGVGLSWATTILEYNNGDKV